MMNESKKHSQNTSQQDFANSVLKVLLVTALYFSGLGAAVANFHVEPQPYNESEQVQHHVYNELYAKSSNLRSKSDVINDVKNRYKGAKVLRIKLNSSGTSYKVRILMPSGKVKNVSVSAQK